MLEHGCRCFVGGIIITLFKVDIHTVAPRIFFHNTDKFGAKGVLCAVHVITQSLKNGICTIICNSKQPSDVRPFVNVSHHTADGYAAFCNRSCLIHFERKQTNGIDTVTVITQGFIHSGIAHECPNHDAFSFQLIPQIDTPPSVICCNSKSTLADLPSSKVTLCLESQAALY